MSVTYFDNVKKHFGFGCMRLPMRGEQVDYEKFTKMVDFYMAQGFNTGGNADGSARPSTYRITAPRTSLSPKSR